VKVLGVVLACVFASVDAGAQGHDRAVYRSAADLVALNVVVTDRGHRFVGGLSSADFLVLEDGVPQDVAFFAATDVPLDLALLLDTSGSMTDRIGILQRAARKFLDTLRPGDRAMIVDIKNATRTLHPLGPDIRAAAAAIDQLQAGGGTGLYNGLYTTLKGLMKERQGAGDDIRRQAIVVLSDGMDTSSLLGFDDVMEVAKQSGIATYTITVRSPFAPPRGAVASSPSEFAMKTLAEETGARAFFPLVIEELGGVYGAIAQELASQYALGYTPKNVTPDGGFRRIFVQVPERPGVRTRTRSGYTLPRQSRAGTEE
jgi:VWFA-related protein